MERFVRCLVFLTVCAAPVFAEDAAPKSDFPLPDMSAEVPRLVQFVEAVGKGNADAAYDSIQSHLSRQFQNAKGPFESGSRESWLLEFGKVANGKPEFESVEFIGYCPVSSASRVVVLIANGKYGPVLFRFQMFRYQEEWKVTGVGYDTLWDIIATGYNCERFDHPVIYKFSTEKQAAVDQQSKS